MRRQSTARTFKTNPKNRATIPKPPLNVAAISENRGSIDQNVSDMNKAKRVKFTLPEQTQPPRTDAPKTSEFAFFKKLKEDIGGYYSRPLHKDGTYQPKASTPNDRNSTDTSTPPNMLKYADRNLRSSLRSESERPIGQFSFLSPPMHAEPNDVYGLNSREDEFKGIKQRSSFACTNVTPDGKNLVLSPFARASNHSGNQNAGTGIFSIKRQKLRQLVADTFPVVGQCSSNWFDLASVLLNRLLPNGNKKARCQEGVLDTNYRLAAVPGLDAEEEIQTRNTTEFEYTSRWTDYFPEYWSGHPPDSVLSKWDVSTSNIPLIGCNAETYFLDEKLNLNRCFDDKAMKSLFRARDPSYCLSSHNYESVSSDHLQELDGVHNSNEPRRREPRSLLLRWDVDEEKEPTFCSAVATSSGVAYQQTFDDSLDATNIENTSILCSDYTLASNLLSCTHSTGAHWHENQRDRQENYAVVAANQFRSFNQQYFIMAQHRDTRDLLEEQIIGLDCQEESGRKDHSEALLFSGGRNYDLGWERSSLSEFYGKDRSSHSRIFHFPFEKGINSFDIEEGRLYSPKQRKAIATFSEGAFDTPNWFSANLHAPLGKLLGHSLLLDNSGGVRSEEEINFDDDNQWKSS
ncbi:uncharacterized protein [Coffea arabica]|uniref:Uncharacterized protein isoform X1 n=1 Tax=Coffea arabica TaxID=13443 RepID=A0A6P6UT68_COFAR